MCYSQALCRANAFPKRPVPLKLKAFFVLFLILSLQIVIINLKPSSSRVKNDEREMKEKTVYLCKLSSRCFYFSGYLFAGRVVFIWDPKHTENGRRRENMQYTRVCGIKHKKRKSEKHYKATRNNQK